MSMAEVSPGNSMGLDLQMDLDKCSESDPLSDSSTSSRIAFQRSTSGPRQRSLSSICSSQTTYHSLVSGHTIEFYDKSSMTYMTIRMRHTSTTSSQLHDMEVDSQANSVPNVPIFSVDSNCRTRRNTLPHRRKIVIQRPSESVQHGNRYDFQLFYSNSVAWCREDQPNDRQLKRWIPKDSRPNYSTSTPTTLCGKRKYAPK